MDLSEQRHLYHPEDTGLPYGVGRLASLLRQADARGIRQARHTWAEGSSLCALAAAFFVSKGRLAKTGEELRMWSTIYFGHDVPTWVVDMNDRYNLSFLEIADELEQCSGRFGRPEPRPLSFIVKANSAKPIPKYTISNVSAEYA